MVLLTLGLSMVLVPFSLGMTWASHRSMALVAGGFVLLFLFAVHEQYYAKRPIIPFSLLFSRNVAGSCLVSIVLFVSYFSWDSYYSSYLQVVHGLSISEAGYIDHIYGLGMRAARAGQPCPLLGWSCTGVLVCTYRPLVLHAFAA